MEIVFTDSAVREFERFSSDLQHLFLSHFEKIRSLPPRRHMKYGGGAADTGDQENTTQGADLFYGTPIFAVIFGLCLIALKKK